jgi:hypothetical protein
MTWHAVERRRTSSPSPRRWCCAFRCSYGRGQADVGGPSAARATRAGRPRVRPSLSVCAAVDPAAWPCGYLAARQRCCRVEEAMTTMLTTGSNESLGFEAPLAAARRGLRLGHRPQRRGRTEGRRRPAGRFVRSNATDDASVDAPVTTVCHLDMLVNNAGIARNHTDVPRHRRRPAPRLRDHVYGPVRVLPGFCHSCLPPRTGRRERSQRFRLAGGHPRPGPRRVQRPGPGLLLEQERPPRAADSAPAWGNFACHRTACGSAASSGSPYFGWPSGGPHYDRFGMEPGTVVALRNRAGATWLGR